MAMIPFWVEFEQRQPACVEAGSSEEAGKVAQEVTGAAPTKIRSLPYPALPRIGEQSNCPALCYEPRRCAGHSCCPQSYACSE